MSWLKLVWGKQVLHVSRKSVTILRKALAVGAGKGSGDIASLRVTCISCSSNPMYDSVVRLAVYALNSVSHNGCRCVVIVDVLAVCRTDCKVCIHVVDEFIHLVWWPAYGWQT